MYRTLIYNDLIKAKLKDKNFRTGFSTKYLSNCLGNCFVDIYYLNTSVIRVSHIGNTVLEVIQCNYGDVLSPVGNTMVDFLKDFDRMLNEDAPPWSPSILSVFREILFLDGTEDDVAYEIVKNHTVEFDKQFAKIFIKEVGTADDESSVKVNTWYAKEPGDINTYICVKDICGNTVALQTALGNNYLFYNTQAFASEFEEVSIPVGFNELLSQVCNDLSMIYNPESLTHVLDSLGYSNISHLSAKCNMYNFGEGAPKTFLCKKNGLKIFSDYCKYSVIITNEEPFVKLSTVTDKGEAGFLIDIVKPTQFLSFAKNVTRALLEVFDIILVHNKNFRQYLIEILLELEDVKDVTILDWLTWKDVSINVKPQAPTEYGFDTIGYLQYKCGDNYKYLSDVSIANCKTKEDCDELIMSLSILK